MHRVHNFSAGPATLPTEVIDEVSEEIGELSNLGMSILEVSHRGADYSEIHSDTLHRLRELTGAPEEFEVILLGGGATLQFACTAMNLADGGQPCEYLVTGTWGKKAVQSAQAIRQVNVIHDGANYTGVPSPEDVPMSDEASYRHLTPNETIDGVRIPDLHKWGNHLVLDVSSEFLTRPIPWDSVDLVYAGAQKSIGPAGLTVVIVRRSALNPAKPLPAYLDYQTHIKGESMANTPPVSAIWVTNKMAKWIQSHGGAQQMERSAIQRASQLYEAIDSSGGFYANPVTPSDRSQTNVVFNTQRADLTDKFLTEAAGVNLVNLKGHRSVGGMRASMYCGLADESVDALVEFMLTFQAQNR